MENDRYREVARNIGNLGINISPRSYSFIRFIPPLNEIPEVDPENVDINLEKITGKLALFTYIPFCTGACTFCFYHKKVNATKGEVDSFLVSLEKQAKSFASRINEKPIDSIYVGGGTPSFLDLQQMQYLFQIIGSFNIGGAESSTFEVSPETIDKEKIQLLLSNGIKRVSMGVQSLDDRILQATKRRYDAQKAIEKIELLRQLCPSYNLDLIYGFDGQTRKDITACLELVKEIQPPSVTFYQKWFSMKDRFGIGKQNQDNGLIDGVIDTKMLIEQFMEDLGYSKDSLFRFVKQQKDGCSYCRTVWEDNSCLALGPSAYSFIDGLAFQNTRNVKRFQETVDQGLLPIARMKQLSRQEQATRALILGIKTAGAYCMVDISAIENRYHVQISKNAADLIKKLNEFGAVAIQGSRVSFSKEGALFAEGILLRLLEEGCFK